MKIKGGFLNKICSWCIEESLQDNPEWASGELWDHNLGSHQTVISMGNPMTTQMVETCWKLSLPLLSLCQVGCTVLFVLEWYLRNVAIGHFSGAAHKSSSLKLVSLSTSLAREPAQQVPLCSTHWLVQRHIGVHRVWYLDSHCLEMFPSPWKYAPAAPHSGKTNDALMPVNPKTCKLKSHPSWPQTCEKPVPTVCALEMFEVAYYTALYSNNAAGWDKFHCSLYTVVFMVRFACSQGIHGEGNGTPLQYSCLESPMDGGAWWAAVYGVATSQTRLRDFTFTFHFMHWRRKWQPTLVFLPGESQGQRSLVGCLLWGRTESDTTEAT